jgi:elongation factor P--(R)-beta-lysine ligase
LGELILYPSGAAKAEMGKQVEGNATPSPFLRAWWNRERYQDRRPLLLARGRIQAGLRAYFVGQGFTEVETAQIQVSPGNETHLHGLAVELKREDGMRLPRYLHTSPEFAMKKLLAAGETKIFSFARVFRDREVSATHSPEFTMLEWYRVGEPYEGLMEDCETIVAIAAREAGADRFRHRGREADPFAVFERLTLESAFRRDAGVELFGGDLTSQAARIGLVVAAGDTWSDLFSKVLSDRIEPGLGVGHPTILCEYPASEAALARLKPADPRVAERFELYACGVELANAFRELTDPAEQRIRFEADMAQKQLIYGTRYPIDEDFLAALAHMPEASGAALGFDRLVMLATGAARIEDVLWTPVA